MTNKLTSISAISLLAAFSLSTSSCGNTQKPVLKAQTAPNKDPKKGNEPTNVEKVAQAVNLVKVAEEFAQGKVEIDKLKTDFDKFRRNINDINVLADQNGHNFAFLVASGHPSEEAFNIIDQFLSQVDSTKLTLQLEQFCQLSSTEPEAFAHFLKLSDTSYSQALANVFIQQAYDQGPQVLTKTVKTLNNFGIENDKKVYTIVSKNNGPTHRGMLSTVLFSIADQSTHGDKVKEYFGTDEESYPNYMNYVGTLFSFAKEEDLNTLAIWAYENRDVPGVSKTFKDEYESRENFDKKAMRERLFEQATYKHGIGDEKTGALGVLNHGFLPSSALSQIYFINDIEGGLVDCITKLVGDPVDSRAVAAHAAFSGAVRLSLEKPEGDFESKREFSGRPDFSKDAGPLDSPFSVPNFQPFSRSDAVPPYAAAPTGSKGFVPGSSIPGGPSGFAFNARTASRDLPYSDGFGLPVFDVAEEGRDSE